MDRRVLFSFYAVKHKRSSFKNFDVDFFSSFIKIIKNNNLFGNFFFYTGTKYLNQQFIYLHLYYF